MCAIIITFLTPNNSGLAVQPNRDEMPPAGSRDAVFGLAQDAAMVGEGEQIRRTITMVRLCSFYSCSIVCCVFYNNYS